jgi:hypothetical protein
MRSRIRQPAWLFRALFSASLSMAGSAGATTIVTVIGNTAHADISLDDGLGHVYTADVTIVFDSPQNLTADTLGLTAQLVDPADTTLISRFPGPLPCGATGIPPCNVAVDPAFPMMITVEPPALPDLYRSGFEDAEPQPGSLNFRNAYSIEVHTHALTWIPQGPYRLFKAPIGGNFRDYSAEILNGSVRARDRDGGFSQFMLLKDTRPSLVFGWPFLAASKLVDLQLRLSGSAIANPLMSDLNADLNAAGAALSSNDYPTAMWHLDAFTAAVNANAGSAIPNLWRAEHDLNNDAGELLGLAATLRFSLARLNGAP